MQQLKSVHQPSFVILSEIAKNNISYMKQKADYFGLTFRPHFKTHQSIQVGQWFAEAGVDKITVSSLQMALQFAEAGWKDICVAFPFNIREVELAQQLIAKVKMNFCVAQLNVLEQMTQLQGEFGVYIEIDTDYHRSGISDQKISQIHQLLERIKAFPHIQFRGFLTHDGHTYQAKNPQEIIAIRRQSNSRMIRLRQLFPQYQQAFISIGDTPSCSISNEFNGINEIRPGNFVYFDLMQLQLGSCSAEQISAFVACPVVEVHSDENKVVLYGGGIHLSKEYVQNAKGEKNFGQLCILNSDNSLQLLPDSYIYSLSQEHALARVNSQVLSQIKAGDLLGVIPVHSCLAANLLLQNQIVL